MKNHPIEYSLITVIAIISIGITLLYEKLSVDIDRTGLWVFVGLFFTIVIYTIVRNLIRKGADPYEIINPLLITFTLYSMMLPINYLVNARSLTSAYVMNPVMFQYLIICLIGLIGLLIGYYLLFAEKCVLKLPVPIINKRELKAIGLTLFVFGVFSFATNVASFGGIGDYIRVGYGAHRHIVMRQAFAIGAGLDLIGISLVILMLSTVKDNKKAWFIILLLIFVGCLTIALLIGHRRILIYVLLMAFVIFNYGCYRIKLKWFIIVGFVSYVFFFTYAHTRSVWAELGVIQGTIVTFDFVCEHPNILLPFVGGEFIPPAQVITKVLGDSTFQFKYGLSYLIGFIRILPRAGRIWPEALQQLAAWRMDTYYPGLAKRGVGFAFFTVAEGFVNFGHLGVFLHMIVYGFIAKVMFVYHRQNPTSIFALLTYAAIFPLILFEGIRAELGQFLWSLTHTYLGPIFLIIIFMKIMSHSVSKNKI